MDILQHFFFVGEGVGDRVNLAAFLRNSAARTRPQRGPMRRLARLGGGL